MDWTALGTAIGGLVMGAGGVGLWWRQQKVGSSSSEAQVTVIDLMRQEVERLGKRVAALEAREGRLIRHIYRLESLVRELGKEPPQFDIDSDTIRAGLTD